jgi:hypothetical protein
MKILPLACLCSMTLWTVAFTQAPQMHDFSIKIGVEEVRIDTVVLDSKPSAAALMQ